MSEPTLKELGAAPKRIQRKRTKGWKMPEGAVYVGRPTLFGNPFKAVLTDSGPITPRMAVDGYRAMLKRPEKQVYRNVIKATLRGKDLACWCPIDQPCHADVLLEVANED
jgi:hypothetical protein